MAALVISASGTVHALDSVSYGEQVLGPLKNATAIEALGPDVFGEQINAYTGGLTFAQTDLSIPGGSALPVAVTRRLVVDGNKSPSKPNEESLWRGYSFGEWELDIPYLAGTYTETEGWVVSTSTPTARCSSPTSRAQYRPRDVSEGEVFFSSYQFWNGIALTVPGQGEQALVYAPASDALPRPAGTEWTRLKTKSNWHFACLSALKSGQEGEGFLALAPDGTRYYFDWMVNYTERALHGRGVYTDYTGITREVSADLPRRAYRLYPTRVEDRFGNWVTYTWSGANLTRIASSDHRSIILSYLNGRVISASDGVQTIGYVYTDGLLTTVTQPDGSSWRFESAPLLGVARFVQLSDADPFDHPFQCQLMRRLTGDEADLRVVHPSGVTATYRLSFKRLFRTGLAGSQTSCSFADGSWEDKPSTTFMDHMPSVPTRFDVLGLKSKMVTGPSIPTATWTYTHQDSYSLVGTAPYPEAGTRKVTATRPDGVATVDVYGTDALANEGQLLSSEVRSGSTVISRTINAYVQTSEMSAMPFPDWMGEPLGYEFIRGRSDYNRPMKSSITQRDGTHFTRSIDQFDVFGRPIVITKKSGPAL